MKSISLRLLLILLVCAGCFWALRAKTVRLGKDLRGGVSLVYSVALPDKGDRGEEMLGQVIETLKQRVNPQGVLDISMQPQGLDRIEIVMPLPDPEVRGLQQEYKRTLAEVMARAQVSPTELERALATGTAVERYGGFGTRGDDVRALQNAYDKSVTARAELERAKAAGADAAAISAIEDELVVAELTADRLRNGLLGQVLPESRLTKALGLSDEPRAALDASGTPLMDAQGRPVMEEAPRKRELAAIKAEFPYLADQIPDLVAKHDAYLAKRKGLDDPEDLMRLLRGAGVLDFRIAVEASHPEGVDPAQLREQLAKRGPKNTDSPIAAWFQINDLKQWYKNPQQLEALRRDPIAYFEARDLVAAEYAGNIYLLLYTTPAKSMTHGEGADWSLTDAFRTTDSRLGGMAVGFQLDSSGGSRMARLTAPHVGQPMAIVLDDQVYSAPNLNSVISGNGTITGDFSDADISYLIRVLAAGALGARVSPDPVSINILGPAIGLDNLVRGKEAIYLSVAVTCLLMLLYYFLSGLLADIALAINTLMIFGIMALIDGTFTLPGLAGIALSVAMAVDANVLIYERIREEVQRGETLKSAINLGFRRALSAIVDGNVTNLIAVVVLYKIGATEVKGFALTMCIGVVTTLFTGLFVSRTFFLVLTEWLGVRRLPTLATTIPAVSRMLTPKVDWIKLRPVLWGFCIVVSVTSIVLLLSRGRDIFETEFRGGTAMTLSTRDARPGEPADPDGKLLLKRPDVERRVREAGLAAGTADPILYELRSANVLTVGEAGSESEASSFQIRVGNPAKELKNESEVTRRVVEAVVNEFANELDVQLPLAFKGAGERDHSTHTFTLEKDVLGECIGRPDVKEPLGDFRGGVAVVVEDIDPPATVGDLEERIARMRGQPDFSETAGRKARVVGLDPVDPSDPAKGFTSVAVMVSDPILNGYNIEFDTWDRQLAASEWNLVRSALEQQASLDDFSSFSPVVAENLAASAIVAVILSLIGMLGYIWVRFGSFRFSTAAIMALAFNVACCLGFLAVAPWFASTAAGRALYVEEFRIDLNVIAALLTIVGYAINDTIVILDRIRENKGKLPFATRACVNDSINQTFSRTVLTGGSTIATAIILIVLGGTGIRPFAYTFFVGLVAGTFSSVAVAAPMVYSRREEEEARKRAELVVRSPSGSPLPA